MRLSLSAYTTSRGIERILAAMQTIMKAFIFILSIAFIVQSTSAGWRDNVEISHWNQINTIINGHYGDIKKQAENKGTTAALQCSEEARRKWADLTKSGFGDVTSCVRSAGDQGSAQVCCQRVDHYVFEESLIISKNAVKCINSAH